MDHADTAILARPKFARWLFERGIKPAAAAERLGCSKQTVLNICQPFDHPKRHVPRLETLAKIVEWTGGEVTAADFYPPSLNGSAAAAACVPEDVQ